MLMNIMAKSGRNWPNDCRDNHYSACEFLGSLRRLVVNFDISAEQTVLYIVFVIYHL